MAGKIVVNYNAVEEKTFQLITEIETELTTDIAAQYKSMLDMFANSKGETADRLREQLNKEQIMIENLAGLLKDISQFIMNSATVMNNLDTDISNHMDR